MRNLSVTYPASKNPPSTYLPEATFHALADPTRLAVLELLRHQPQSAGQIASAFSISRPAISKHLRQLHKARLVLPTRRGRHRFFALNTEPLQAVDAWLERYRMFWAGNLNSLKIFVEEEHAREMDELSNKGPGKTHRKHK
jgi:DNA-binding transcriptional ArsR family regulator